MSRGEVGCRSILPAASGILCILILQPGAGQLARAAWRAISTAQWFFIMDSEDHGASRRGAGHRKIASRLRCCRHSITTAAAAQLRMHATCSVPHLFLNAHQTIEHDRTVTTLHLCRGRGRRVHPLTAQSRPQRAACWSATPGTRTLKRLLVAPYTTRPPPIKTRARPVAAAADGSDILTRSRTPVHTDRLRDLDQ